MPHHDLEYPKNARNTVIRMGKDRGDYLVIQIFYQNKNWGYH